ncbi:MAG: hypothetical protein RL112_932 [Planctomycetota bacterium]
MLPLLHCAALLLSVASADPVSTSRRADGLARPAWLGGEQLLDASAQLEEARALARRGDAESELRAWERLLDRCEAPREARSEAMARVGELRRRVGPAHADPRDAKGWRALVVVLRRVECDYTDLAGRKQSFAATMGEDDLRGIRLSMESLADHVRQGTGGVRRLDCEWRIVDEPQRRWSGDAQDGFWIAPWDVQEALAPLAAEAPWESIFVYAKYAEGGRALPRAYAGCTYGADLGLGGAGWTHMSWTPDARADGEIELHEWLHQADWAFARRCGYPDSFVPDPDESLPHGVRSGQKGIDWCLGAMRGQVTRGMWHELSLRDPLPNPFARRSIARFKHLGPFPARDAREAHAKSFLAEDALTLRGRPEGAPSAWRELDLSRSALPSAQGVAAHYLGTHLESDEERQAMLFLSCDAPVRIWLDGVELAARERGARDEWLPLRLARGENRLLVKVVAGGASPRLVLRLADGAGSPISGVAARVD